MAWTIEQYEALDAAIAQGITQVMYGNKIVIYRSLDEMMQLRNAMRQELGLNTAPKRIYAKHSKGL